ncbi:MAG: glycosyltransferase [Hyphomonadaceae bacterium]
MRIALTADPELPVPPKLYGGIERIIDLLAHGLVANGHDVTVFAHPDSATAGRLAAWPGRSSGSLIDTTRNSALLAEEALRKRFDIIHSFSRIAYLAPILALNIPKVMTYQRAISQRSVRWAHALSRGTLSFTAISKWMMQHVSDSGTWDMIPNGVSLDVYGYQPVVTRDAPLVFLGRIEEIKGPHLAIEIARRLGRRLIIAGNIPEDKREWVQQHVLSGVDGQLVQYIGPVDDAQKNKLLGEASAFLMPILWDEPFGIVMAEAMACGTPILGLERGAVPEVVEDGTTGFVRKTVDELVIAAERLDTLDRSLCRKRVERLYSQHAIVEQYQALYRRRIRSGMQAA